MRDHRSSSTAGFSQLSNDAQPRPCVPLKGNARASSRLGSPHCNPIRLKLGPFAGGYTRKPVGETGLSTSKENDLQSSWPGKLGDTLLVRSAYPLRKR